MRTFATLTCLFAALAVARPASAATVVGSTDEALPDLCSSGFEMTPKENPAYVIPVSGIATSFATNRPAAGGAFAVQVGTYVPLDFFVDGATAPTPVTSAGITRIPARMSVRAGQVLGLWVEGAAPCLTGTGNFNEQNYIGASPTAPAAGETRLLSQLYVGGYPAISAVIEADADGDGYGDETQDSCPSQFAVHIGPCQFTLTTSLKTEPKKVGLGDATQLLFTVKNTHPAATARNISLSIGIPGGLRLYHSTRAPCTTSGALMCNVSNLAAGQSTTFKVSARAIKRGKQKLKIKATALGDLNAASNSSTKILKIGVPVRCLVPDLKGKSLERARNLARRNGCVIGQVNFKYTAGNQLGKVLKVRARKGALLPLRSSLTIEVGA